VVHHGDQPQDYVTRVFTRTAVRLIRHHVAHRRPLYLQLDEVAPHVQRGGHSETPDCNPVPDPRDAGRFQNTPLPDPPSFNEGDMNDKPNFMRRISPLTDDQVKRMTRNFRCGLAALRSVDRGVARVYDAIKRSGELDRTVFIFYTDNGVFYGEHRLATGKLNPYEEALSTPLVMRVPGRYVKGRAVSRVSAPVANIDLAPTILRLAHGRPCRHRGRCRIMDGRSLTPLIAGEGRGWAKDRPIGMEIDLGHGSAQHLAACEYTGVHVGNKTLVKYRRVQKPGTNDCVANREWEEYNLGSDPFQLHNLCFGGDPHSCPNSASHRRLRKEVRRIRRCAGVPGRDPRSGGRPYCG
jgi:arylsulfatase A-like enzyme